MDTETTQSQPLWIALGSNLGDRLAILRGAKKALAKIAGLRLVGSSSLYRTAPVGGPTGQGEYLNAVLQFEATLAPFTLLERCQQIELDFGRERQERWGARTLDLDLIAYGTLCLTTTDLQLPHPRAHERRFVLAPLAELVPTLSLPGQPYRVAELLATLPGEDEVTRATDLLW
ncbi:MAG: 2-amino-4-hydroxy-6-hydroxymethyldihydropteridine diphosphokinase [Desulfuromonas sp.]|nr:MAG: 2-amino-4-hydroxy-6-hydroxymethyldihydropteridine diphosphokinase [Desulfuromonas sp.]